MTLGSAAKAGLRLIVWCRGCQHQVEPEPAQLAELHLQLVEPKEPAREAKEPSPRTPRTPGS